MLVCCFQLLVEHSSSKIFISSSDINDCVPLQSFLVVKPSELCSCSTCQLLSLELALLPRKGHVLLFVCNLLAHDHSPQLNWTSFAGTVNLDLLLEKIWCLDYFPGISVMNFSGYFKRLARCVQIRIFTDRI